MPNWKYLVHISQNSILEKTWLDIRIDSTENGSIMLFMYYFYYVQLLLWVNAIVFFGGLLSV